MDILKARFHQVTTAYMVALVYHAPEGLLDTYKTRLNEIVAIADDFGYKDLGRDLWHAFIELISMKARLADKEK